MLPLFAARGDAQRTRNALRDSRSRIDTAFAFDRRGTVTVTAGSGDIIVTGSTDAQVRIHASSDNDNLRLDVSANTVALELTGNRTHGDSRFEVSVPQGVRVIARAQSGDVSIRGTKGEVEIHAQSGDVQLDDVVNRLDVTTLSGDIKARAIAGDVSIDALSGSIDLTDVKGAISVQTTSGDIDLRGVASKVVRAKTTSGDVTYEGVVDPAGHYELTSHSGDVRLAIPRDASAQLSVKTWSGDIESDFPITLRPGEHGIGSSTAKSYTFEIGGGGARITAETFSGDINIRRAGSR